MRSAAASRARAPAGSPSRGTVHDPLDEIPIREVLRATYFEGDLSATVAVAARIPAVVFAPFHHGRNDDWSALASAAGEAVPRPV